MSTYVILAPICWRCRVRPNALISRCVRSVRALRQCVAPLSDGSSLRLPAFTAHTTRARELVLSWAASAIPLVAFPTYNPIKLLKNDQQWSQSKAVIKICENIKKMGNLCFPLYPVTKRLASSTLLQVDGFNEIRFCISDCIKKWTKFACISVFKNWPQSTIE